MKVERLINYAGSKTGMYHLYPEPVHDIIIEPFAGGAGYSLAYYDREVVLYELDPTIYKIWKYLQRATKKDILSLPDLKPGQRIATLKLSQVEKDFIGLWCMGSPGRPSRTVSKNWVTKRPHWLWGSTRKRKIADNLYKIKHWKIHNESWESIRKVKNATVFVDPPYTIAGPKTYSYHRVKYDKLAKQCRSKFGSVRNQIIVCEGPDADWLPFYKLNPQSPENGSAKEIALGKEYVYTG